MSISRFHNALAALALAAIVAPNPAAAQFWTDWTHFGDGVMAGTLGGGSVTFRGEYDGYQLRNGNNSPGVYPSPTCGLFFWCLTGPYTSPGVNAPVHQGFIQYKLADRRGTITFENPVTDPLVAFTSLGNTIVSTPVTVDFGPNRFTVLSDNVSSPAAWGIGTYSLLGNTITGNEFSGTIRLIGTFSSFSYRVIGAEDWSGLTVGYGESAAPPAVVPEPASLALLATGLLGVGFVARRRREK